jgi:pSer/pThr/pTyr-binding forkhead associated (FHA) protein
MPRWRIEFHGLGPSTIPLGFDIVGDTVLGRGSDSAALPDLDFDAYGASDRGVSRRHAVLRPSKNRLYLIDLGSTNGTLCNAVRITNGQAKALSHNDTITLGTLTFEVKTIATPR